MPQPTSRQLLRRLGVAFILALAGLTALLLANFAARTAPRLGETAGSLTQALLAAVPFTAAMTIPMAVFLAVLWVFSRLGSAGVLAEARKEQGGVMRLVAPAVAAAACVAGLNLVSNAQFLPRSNERLARMLSTNPTARSDRVMSIGELRLAARKARADAGADAALRAAAFEVEVHKKVALAAANITLALAGAALAFLFQRGRVWLMLSAGLGTFGTYYMGLVAGEALAERLVLSPFVGMWGVNAVLTVVALAVLWRLPTRDAPERGGGAPVPVRS